MDHIWGASIVETFIMIKLWEIQNKEVHGKEEVVE